MILRGWKELTKYVKMSRETLLKLEKEGFPMVKLEGQWTSHTELIDDYLKDKILERL